MTRAAVFITSAVLLCFFGGCGEPEFEMVRVAGDVTLDGQPLPNAVVVFQPIAGDRDNKVVGVGSSARTDQNGHFVLKTQDIEQTEAAVVGQHSVVITTGEAPDDSGRIINEKVPPWYRDGRQPLQFTVTGPTDEANFELSTRPPGSR